MVTAQYERKEIGNLVIENIPEIPASIAEGFKQYQNTRSAGFVDWDPHGDGDAVLISTRFGETNQFHIVTRPGGTRNQVTFFDEPVSGGRFSPAPRDSGFLFTKDIGGNEFYQLFYFDLKTGKYRMLTDGESRNGMGVWSNLGDRFIYASTRRNSKDYDLYIFRMDERFPEELVFEGTGLWSPVKWSPDDAKVTIYNYQSINESYLYILDVKTGKLQAVREAEEEPISYGGGLWSKDGKGLYVISDFKSEYRNLKYYDIEKQEFINLTENIHWDVESLSLSPDGKNLAFRTNENGIHKLYILDTDTGVARKAPGFPEGIFGRMDWNKDSRRLAITIETSTAPSDVYVLNTISFFIERWTFSETGGLNEKDFITPALIEYPTFDEVNGATRKIPAFYYKPTKFIGPHPVLIYMHGGPEGQFQPDFSHHFQYYLNELGIAIVAPNVRGSSGYGKTYVKLDNGFKREDSVKDIGALIEWIRKQPELDSGKIGVMGGSYGGYMVLASMIHYNDQLKCGIDMVGISNFVTFLTNTQSYRRDLRRVEYGDERDPEMRKHLESISPTSNAHRITKPMFIVQGLNDPRVPATESEQMLQAIRNNGGSAWYLLAKDEGHGFRKKLNRDFYDKAVILFLKKHLLDQEIR